MLTTYDFATNTFGHATMVVGPTQVEKVLKARVRLDEETAKSLRGEPFDALFVYGVEPESWIIEGKKLLKVGDRLWQWERAEQWVGR